MHPAARLALSCALVLAASPALAQTPPHPVTPHAPPHPVTPRTAPPPPAAVSEPFGGPAAPRDVAAPPSGAVHTASGLSYRVLRAGTGTAHPTAASTVEVRYTGWSTDGHMFDSSLTRGQNAQFPLAHVIRGWTEGVQQMVEGEQARFWIPGNLAYGMAGAAGARAGVPLGTLVFDIELVHIVVPGGTAMLTNTPPPDVAHPPTDAVTTASGLAYKILQPGTGARHPAATNTVEVHYTGWTTDGRMFDSSVTRGEPAQFPLNRVIPGWTEGVQLMVEGQRMRFWIPGNLAYDQPGRPARPGVPHGTLVFDVELLRIVQ